MSVDASAGSALSSFKIGDGGVRPLQPPTDISLLSPKSARLFVEKESQMAFPGAPTTLPADHQPKQPLSVITRLRKARSSTSGSNRSPFVEALRVEEAQLFEPGDSGLYHITKVCALSASKHSDQQSSISNHAKSTESSDGALFICRRRRVKAKNSIKVSHSVEKRNARERTRVHTVNQAFAVLKYHLPTLRANTKRVSKLRILRTAIDYIDALRKALRTEPEMPADVLASVETELVRTKTFNPASQLEPKMKTQDMTLMSLSGSYGAASSRTFVSTLPAAATGSDANAAMFMSDGASGNSLLNQSFSGANPTLMKLPYMGYENLYVNPAAASYMRYPPMPTSATNTVMGPTPVASAAPDPGMFYYNAGHEGDSAFLNSNVYF